MPYSHNKSSLFPHTTYTPNAIPTALSFGILSATQQCTLSTKCTHYSVQFPMYCNQVKNLSYCNRKGKRENNTDDPP